MTFEKKTTAFTLSLNSDLFCVTIIAVNGRTFLVTKLSKLTQLNVAKATCYVLVGAWRVQQDCGPGKDWRAAPRAQTRCAPNSHTGTQVLLELETRTQAQCRPTSARRRNSHTGVLRNYTQVHCRPFAKGKPREQSAQRYTLNMHFGTCVHTDTLHAHRLHIGALQVHRQISMLQALFW